ncbi:MAG TPA: ATP-binding protein [Kofleriaceae bacterium]|jgi:two-component system chemotaxis sensor kinase CheA
MTNPLKTLVLPAEISRFERSYLARVNRIALIFFALHVPAFTLVAAVNHTGAGIAALLTTLVLAGPAIAYFTLRNPRIVSVVDGITAMCMGGLLVHFGQGPVQIEMHFYFFALLAMCSVFGNPMVIVAATITVVVHHALVWLLLPSSIFNYEAQWWVVGVHAIFVLLEAAAACFIARSFFDNVIGLERIVQQRTSEVDAKNRDLRVLLDNVQQGFLTIDRSGRLAPERSAAIDRWFGAPAADASWFDYLQHVAPAIAATSRLAWTEVVDDIMPLELTLAQMPARATVRDVTYRIEYCPIGAAAQPAHFMVIVTDITDELAREHAEEQRREVMAVFERVLADRGGLLTFVEDGTTTIQALSTGTMTEPSTVKRALHTLKGNAALFQLESIARACHTLEDRMEDARAIPAPPAYSALAQRWDELVTEARRMLDQRGSSIELEPAELVAIEHGIHTRNLEEIARLVQRLTLEPTSRRLHHFAEQGVRIAERLGRGGIEVRVEDHDVRLDRARWAPFWSGFIHGIRNAIDHGIEDGDTRLAAGKSAEGVLSLRTRETADELVIEIEDDGRGIDWDAVRERACAAGLPAKTPADLEAALFTDGVSTSEHVTEISGRGVGMRALRHGTHALGGTLAVESVLGKGTLVRMIFPKTAASEHVVALAS